MLNPKESFLALSLSNLFFIRVWQELIFAEPANRFYLSTPLPVNYLAAILNVILLAAFFYLVLFLYRQYPARFTPKLGAGMLLLLLLIPLNSLRLMFTSLTITDLAATFGNYGLVMFSISLLALALTAAIRWHHFLTGSVTIILFILFPFVFFTFSQALWGAWRSEPPQATVPPPSQAAVNFSASGEKHTTRVLWLVFDELDQRLTFEEKPASVETPELDRLRSKAIYATNAHPPADDTLHSMPALITGDPLARAEPAGAGELQLTLEKTGETLPWSKRENIFTRAEELGYNTGLVGCYLPYCRVIGDSLTTCYWQPFGSVETNTREGLRKTMLNQFLSNFSISPFNQRRHAINVHLSLLEEAKIAAANPDLGLVLVHFSIPHYPWIYHRHRDSLTVFNYDMQYGYFDNLALVDHTLRQLRLAMEDSATWEDTHLLISSDHPWRMELFPTFDGRRDSRVPFLLRFSGQQHSLSYSAPFNTIISHDLILGLLENRFSNADDLLNWLD